MTVDPSFKQCCIKSLESILETTVGAVGAVGKGNVSFFQKVF